MWANAKHDGRPDKYWWRCLFNAAVWLTHTTRVPCSNAAKTRNPLNLPEVPQTNETISAASRPKFTILYRDMWGIYCCLTSFVPIVDTCLSCEDIARENCAMVPRWRIFWQIFGSCISSEPRAVHSDLHSKLALGPHHMWKYGRHPICRR